MLYKSKTHLPILKTFKEPTVNIHSIDDNHTHLQCKGIIGALNACLDNNNLLQLEAHYSGVFTEYLHYAKSPTQTL